MATPPAVAAICPKSPGPFDVGVAGGTVAGIAVLVGCGDAAAYALGDWVVAFGCLPALRTGAEGFGEATRRRGIFTIYINLIDFIQQPLKYIKKYDITTGDWTALRFNIIATPLFNAGIWTTNQQVAEKGKENN